MQRCKIKRYKSHSLQLLFEVSIDFIQLCNFSFHTASNELAVSFCRFTNRIFCVGFEFEGLKLTHVSRREPVRNSFNSLSNFYLLNLLVFDAVLFWFHQKKVNPIIEEYKFVPYIDSVDSCWDWSTALKICVDIVIENSTTHIIRIGEFGITPENESMASVRQYIQSSPLKRVR